MGGQMQASRLLAKHSYVPGACTAAQIPTSARCPAACGSVHMLGTVPYGLCAIYFEVYDVSHLVCITCLVAGTTS